MRVFPANASASLVRTRERMQVGGEAARAQHPAGEGGRGGQSQRGPRPRRLPPPGTHGRLRGSESERGVGVRDALRSCGRSLALEVGPDPGAAGLGQVGVGWGVGAVRRGRSCVLC